jgi:polysaccharide biosynthesis/export protein
MIRHILRLFSLLLLAGLASACGPSLAGLQPLPTADSSQYRLAAGDELRILVPGLTSDLPNQTFVVTLPLAGPVPVAGSTISQLEASIAALLVQRQILVSPTVSIQPVKLRPIYILGEVRNPGEYAFRPNMIVINAISLAGGYTFRANQRKVAIIRQINGQTVTSVAIETTPIQPGDTLRVLERAF